MSELRYNPLLDTWVMHAPNRQGRPHLPVGTCPFCPTSGLVPADFSVLAYPNDFPVLKSPADTGERIFSDVYMNAPAHGYCEVILYTPQHDTTFYSLGIHHIKKLIDLWQQRFEYFSKDDKIQYIHIFENKGEEVGVTIAHPHGQLYAHSWIPQRIMTELINSKLHYEATEKVLIDEIYLEEEKAQKRVIYSNASFMACIPYFTDYPYGVHIFSKKQHSSLLDLDETDKMDLSDMLIKITAAFDTLFDRPFPYMMSIHQVPVNTADFQDASTYYRFHIQFYTPLREKDKIKWYAGSEMGAWAAANPMDVDLCADSLRKCIVP